MSSSSGNRSAARGAGFYIWNPPGSPFPVHLHLAVVDRLSVAIRTVAAGAGARPLCGLLLGRRLPNDQAVIVEDAAPLPSSDEAAVKEQLLKWSPGEGKRLWSVGYYLHRPEGELSLDDSDIALLRRDFSGPGQVMLLTTMEGGRPGAGLFPVEPGEIPRRTRLAFPLSRMELLLASEATAPPPKPEPAPAPPRPRKQRKFTQYDAIRWTSIAIVVFVLAVLASNELPKLWGPKTDAPAAGPAESSGPALDLKVDGSPDRVTVRWNRNAAAIGSGVEGTLSITEGGQTQILVLKQADLATGSVVYFPKAGDVAFQLEVRKANGSKVSERVHLLAGRPQPDGKAAH